MAKNPDKLGISTQYEAPVVLLKKWVDFEYSVNGKTYQFSLPGGGFVSFTDRVEVLGIMGDTNSNENGNKNGEIIDAAEIEDADGLLDVTASDAARKFAADVASVEFSSPELVWVGKVENETTVGALKEEHGLECKYSEELTEEQIAEIDSTAVEPGDWALVSLRAFDTEETLTVTMRDGKAFTVKVTDAQIISHYLSDSGELYEITVTYGDEAKIPNGARLKITEYKTDSEEHENARKAVLADKQAKGEYVDLDDFGFAAFDISIFDQNNNEIEPAAEVQVDITIKGLPGVEDLKTIEDQLAIQHHVETDNGVIVDQVYSGESEAEFLLQTADSVKEEKGDSSVDPSTFSEEDYKKAQKEIGEISENPNVQVTFPAPCFSTFSVTWHYDNGLLGWANYQEERNVTVHYGYMNGDTFVEFEQQPAPAPDSSFGNATEAYLTYDFDGWQAKNEIYYHQNATTSPESGGIRIQNTLYKGYYFQNWLYKNYSGNNSMPAYWDRMPIATNDLAQNSHIYVLYEQKPAATQGGTPTPTNEGVEKPLDPSVTKTSDINHDGTNTIHLTVEGYTSPLKTERMADVILIYDTSGSMDYKLDAETDAGRTEDTRMKATKTAVQKLIHELLSNNDTSATEENAKFRVGLVPFSNRAHSVINVTKNEETLYNAIGDYTGWNGRSGHTYSGLTPGGGTNWEEALQKANEMSVASDRATFVVFITDGNPTFRMTRGNYTDSQLGTIATQDASGQPTTDLSDYHARYNVFGPGSGDWKENTDAVQNGDHVNQTGSEGEGRNYTAALAQAQSIVSHEKHLFTLGIGPAVGRLEALTSATGAAGNYYPATSVDALNDAMDEIITQIKGELGYSNVCITDGITPLTQTVQKSGKGDALPAEDDFTYEKSRAATQEDVNSGIATAVGEDIWFPWDPVSEGAARASYNTTNGAVVWNLGEKFFLEEGTKYRCSFKVWPSQEAYDTIAKLNNGTLQYDSLDPKIRAQIKGDNESGYTLLTNMPNDADAQEEIGSNVGAKFTYQEATKIGNVVNAVENTEEGGTFLPVDSLDLKKQQITIKKEWKNELDKRTQTESVTLNVVAEDAPSSEQSFASIDVGENNTPVWTNSVFISTGLLKVLNGETVIYEKGHDFKLTEADNLAYYWELEADTYRPMVITDSGKGYNQPTAVLLRKLASSATEFDYEIDGGKYQIVHTESGALKATNYRRSNLNLIKKVVKKDGTTDISDAVKDELFEFTVTVTDINGKDVWFSVNAIADDESSKIIDLDTSATAETKNGDNTGFFYAASGTSFTVKMKPGWNLRLINLPSGSDYTIVESSKEGYAFQNAVIDNNGTITVDQNTAVVTGSIAGPNTQFTITATNKLTTNAILIKKTDIEGDQNLEGATFKLYRKNGHGVYELFKDTFTVGENGYLCAGLNAGDYKLEEQTPPAGYIITAKETLFTVSDDVTKVIVLANGQEMASVAGANKDELSVKNEPGIALPASGGPGTKLIYLIGSIMLAFGGVGLVMIRRRRVR